jgi:hypothetical protein
MSDFVRDLLVARRALGNDGDWVFGADSRSGHIAEPKFPLALVAKATGITVSAHDQPAGGGIVCPRCSNT